MELIPIYECLCDRTRLRILNLLCHGPLCVCHIQEILGESQVKISKHLGYLKSRGLVHVRQAANWRIYGLVNKPSRALGTNLACLQDCASEDRVFRRDLEKLKALRRAFGNEAIACCSDRRASGRGRPSRPSRHQR